ELERGLQSLGGLEAGGAAGFLRSDGGLPGGNSIPEVGEGELLPIGVGEVVIIYPRAETALETVPEVPDEGAMMEERAMLLEESVAQPVLQRSASVIHLGEQLFLPSGVPILAVGAGEEFAQAFRGRSFAFGGTDGHDAIVIRQLFQTIRAERRAI